jgi:GTPase SAR1 family protein
LKYKGAQGIFLVYDVTYRESFEAVRYWFREIRLHAPHDVLILLLGNKTDLEAQRVVSFEEGKALADELRASFMECSAKTSANVEAALISMAAQVSARVDDSTSLAA